MLERQIPLASVDEGFEWFHGKWTILRPTHPQHNAALSVVDDDLPALLCDVSSHKRWNIWNISFKWPKTNNSKKKKKKALKLIKFENKEWVIFLNWHKEHSQLSHTPSDLLHTQSAAHKLEHLSVVSCPCFQIIRKTQRRLKWLKTGCSAKSPSQRALYTLPGCNKKEKKKLQSFSQCQIWRETAFINK